MATRTVGVIGAGIAGCAVAYALRNTGVQVTLIEKARGVSGRATTRRRGELMYDHGANFFKLKTQPLQDLVLKRLPTDAIVSIDSSICEFSREGTLTLLSDSEGDRLWTYRTGIHTLGKLLSKASGAHLHTQWRAERLQWDDGHWSVQSTRGEELGPFTHLVLTPPAPQTTRLLKESDLLPFGRTSVVDALGAAVYQSQHTLIFGYDHRWSRRRAPYYGFVNDGNDHPIAWLSFEEDKQGHIPEGQRVLIVQMTPEWTREHFDKSKAMLVAEVAPLVADLLRAPAAKRIGWTDHQRWRYAQPLARAKRAPLAAVESHGLFFAGDYCVGEARVAHALKNGLDVGARIADQL